MTHHLILGGARSGKSRFAEQLATRSGRPVTYIATCQPGKDAELAERIAAHQARRPESWAVIEEPTRLAATLQATARDAHCILVDCLTLWMSWLKRSLRAFAKTRHCKGRWAGRKCGLGVR